MTNLYAGTSPVVRRDDEPQPADTSWIDAIGEKPREFPSHADALAMRQRARDATGEAPESIRRDDVTPLRLDMPNLPDGGASGLGVVDRGIGSETPEERTSLGGIQAPPAAPARSRRVTAPLFTRKPDAEPMGPSAPSEKVAGKEDAPDDEPFAPLPPEPAPAAPPTVTPAATVAQGEKAPPALRDRLADALAERANRNRVGGLAGILARAGEGVNAAVAHRKADYSFGDSLDAKEQAWRDEPVLLARQQMALDDKRKAESRQALLDDLNRRFRESQIAASSPEARLKEIAARGEQERMTDAAKPLPVVLPPAPKEADPLLADKRELLRARTRAALAGAAKASGASGSGGSASPASMSDDAVELGSEVLLTTGAMPSLGAGSGGLRAAILARAGEKIRNGDTRRIPESLAIYGGEKKTIAQQAQREAAIATSGGAVTRTLDTVINNADRVTSRSGLPFADERYIAAQAATGDVDAQNLIESVKTAQAEYARILSMSPSGAGAPFAENMRRAEQVIHVGMTPAQMRAAKAQIESLNKAVQDSAEGVRGEHIRRIVQRDAPPAASGTVRMRAPDGTIEDVPQESVADALADHYERI